jgi:ORF6N domain
MPRKQPVIPEERIEQAIYLIHGQKVVLDFDLAAIYGVSAKRLNQQVRRNIERFPDDFAFLLTQEEFASLRLRIATSNVGRRNAPSEPRCM